VFYSPESLVLGTERRRTSHFIYQPALPGAQLMWENAFESTNPLLFNLPISLTVADDATRNYARNGLNQKSRPTAAIPRSPNPAAGKGVPTQCSIHTDISGSWKYSKYFRDIPDRAQITRYGSPLKRSCSSKWVDIPRKH